MDISVANLDYLDLSYCQFYGDQGNCLDVSTLVLLIHKFIPPLYCVTTKVVFTWVTTLSFLDALNILTFCFIVSMKRKLRVKLTCRMYHQSIKLLTFSRKVSLLSSFNALHRPHELMLVQQNHWVGENGSFMKTMFIVEVSRSIVYISFSSLVIPLIHF
jgi:hypothetical protein